MNTKIKTIVFYSHHMPGWGACTSIKIYKYRKCAENEVKRVNDFNDPYMVCRILEKGNVRDDMILKREETLK